MSFIFKITTTTSPQSFTIPCHNYGAFNATVDYGDGTGSQTVTAYNDSNLTHSFTTAGQHTITIDGTFPNIRFVNDATSAALVDEVVDLGDVGWLMLYAGFQGCTNLTSFSTGTANTTNNTYAQLMFRSCTSLTSVDLTNFDTSNVTSLGNMFQNCSSLTTLDLSSFDTSNVTQTALMFYACPSLTTLDVSSFDTSSVTNMQQMFLNCTSLTNLNIKHFDVSSVTNGTSFLQNANNALTTAAYDELLEAWAAQDVQPNVAWHFGDAQYTVVNIADWYSPRGASSLSIINNKLVSIADSTATFGAAQQIDNLIVGNAYRFVGTATCSNSSAQVYIRVSPVSNVGSPIFNKQATGSVTANDTFTATATTLYVGTIVTGHAANDTVTIDAGITVKEITNYTEANAASEIEYSQENVFGAEEVVNGDFDTDTDWEDTSQGTGTVVIANNIATLTGSSFTNRANLKQLIPTTIGKTYELSALLLQAENAVILYKTGSTNVLGGFNSAQVVLTTFVATQSLTEIQIRSQGGTSIFDNVSLKEITNAVTYQNIAQDVRDTYTLTDGDWVGSAEFWTSPNIGTQWVDNGGGSYTYTGDGSFNQMTSSSTYAIGDTYKTNLQVDSISGVMKFFIGAPSETFDAVGAKSLSIVADGGTGGFSRSSGVVSCTIRDITSKRLIEVAS